MSGTSESQETGALMAAREVAIESELGNIAKGSFIASLDHRLRNPMNSVMGKARDAQRRGVDHQWLDIVFHDRFAIRPWKVLTGRAARADPHIMGCGR